jgi:hypothetical protein
VLDIAAQALFQEKGILGYIVVAVRNPVAVHSSPVAVARTAEFLALDQSHPHRRYIEITYRLGRVLRLVIVVVLLGRHGGGLKKS